MSFSPAPPIKSLHTPASVLLAKSFSLGGEPLSVEEAALKLRKNPTAKPRWSWQAQPVHARQPLVSELAGLASLEPRCSSMAEMQRGWQVCENAGVETQLESDSRLVPSTGAKPRWPLHCPGTNATSLNRLRRRHGTSNPPPLQRAGVVGPFGGASEISESTVGTASFSMTTWRGDGHQAIPCGGERLGIMGHMAPAHFRRQLQRAETLGTLYNFRMHLNRNMD